MPVENEGAATETRVAHDRTIIYRVNVLQHPEKARACGQGAKSSTDRRPVDPPPILDLRIFEQDQDGVEKDITYSYRANFFMWACLEVARPAQARNPNTKDPVPVLCGSPVSGISYLDRPSPAGYFIFPDLSVRHEGRYRLCFTLWEELRDQSLADQNAADGEIVCARCVVRSKPFVVYSAKKFPGLSESTNLSRTVAEQGCRVRIRRDVRMRRRDSKGNGDDGDDDDQEPEKAEPELERPDPVSGISYQSQRAEMSPYAYPPQQYQEPGYHFGAQMAYNSPSMQMPQYSAYNYHYGAQFSQYQYPTLSPQSLQSPSYYQQNSHLRHEPPRSSALDYTSYPASLQQRAGSLPQTPNSLPQTAHTSGFYVKANLEPTPPLPSSAFDTYPSNAASYIPNSNMPNPTSEYHPPPSRYLSNEPSSAPRPKRSYATTFDTSHLDGSLHNGARPDPYSIPSSSSMISALPTTSIPQFDGVVTRRFSSDEESDGVVMEYKRADGTVAKKEWRRS